MVRLVAETARPQAYVALHSGEYALYAPWDSEARARDRVLACGGRAENQGGGFFPPRKPCCTGGKGVPGRRGCAAPKRWAPARALRHARGRRPASHVRCSCSRRRDVLHVFDAGMRARGAQASLAPDLPADLMDVLANLNAYCQCMYGAAGKVAGCARVRD